MKNKTVLILAGSTRQGSFNVRLAKAACAMAIEEGLHAEWIDLNNYPMPLFNQNDEAEHGMPETTKTLKQLFVQADGFIMVTPEYNGMFTPLLKNTIDWLSRPHTENEPPLWAFQSKSAAIMAASPGALGGLRALIPLRLQLANIGVNVVAPQLALGKAHEAFTEAGTLQDARMQGMLRNVVTSLKQML